MRRPALALVLLALPFALVACSASQYRAARALAPAASVQKATTKTAAATTVHVTLSAVGSYGVLRSSFTGSGDFDNANHRGSLHLDVSNYRSFDVILHGTSLYVSAPFLTSFLPAGKTWLRVDSAARTGAFPRLFGQWEQTLARLKKLANVRKVGDETIDGVSTTHFRGTGRLGHSTFDVWVGKDDGYVRRIEAASSGSEGSGKLVATFSDFGKPVTVTVPPASQTADAGSILPFFRRG